MFRLFECCALSFFERFVLSFSLKIERFVSDSAEIWICGLYVNGQIIKNSGVANYILNIDDENLTQDTCLKMLQPIEEYAKFQTIYFACKALNYRFDRNKWDGPRPLSVYVDWFVDNGKLDAHLAFDNPLEHNGNEVGEKLRNILNELKIKKFDDLRGVLSPNVKCYFGK